MPLPGRPDPSQGYVWPLDKYDIYTANRDGTDMQRLTNYDVYTAEGILSPDGKTIVFTSLKDGDLDIYTMNVDGTNVKPPHQHARLRRRPVVVARRHEDRLPRPPSRRTAPSSASTRSCSQHSSAPARSSSS
jgi:hypothetical protein